MISIQITLSYLQHHTLLAFVLFAYSKQINFTNTLKLELSIAWSIKQAEGNGNALHRRKRLGIWWQVCRPVGLRRTSDSRDSSVPPILIMLEQHLNCVSTNSISKTFETEGHIQQHTTYCNFCRCRYQTHLVNLHQQ